MVLSDHFPSVKATAFESLQPPKISIELWKMAIGLGIVASLGHRTGLNAWIRIDISYGCLPAGSKIGEGDVGEGRLQEGQRGVADPLAWCGTEGMTAGVRPPNRRWTERVGTDCESGLGRAGSKSGPRSEEPASSMGAGKPDYSCLTSGPSVHIGAPRAFFVAREIDEETSYEWPRIHPVQWFRSRC